MELSLNGMMELEQNEMMLIDGGINWGKTITGALLIAGAIAAPVAFVAAGATLTAGCAVSVVSYTASAIGGGLIGSGVSN